MFDIYNWLIEDFLAWTHNFNSCSTLILSQEIFFYLHRLAGDMMIVMTT